MFDKLKITITDLAYSAVCVAEDSLTTSSGKEKKKAAIDYVISMLPVAEVFKGFIAIFLSNFIDEAIEHSVKYLKNIKNEEI